MYCRWIYILSILLAGYLNSSAQAGEVAPTGTVFLAATTIGNATAIGSSELPVCTPRSYACNTPASLNYIFVGSGNWDQPENWTNKLIPPPRLTASYEIIIDPAGSSDCILNIEQVIEEGSKLTVLPGKRMRVIANHP